VLAYGLKIPELVFDTTFLSLSPADARLFG